MLRNFALSPLDACAAAAFPGGRRSMPEEEEEAPPRPPPQRRFLAAAAAAAASIDQTKEDGSGSSSHAATRRNRLSGCSRRFNRQSHSNSGSISMLRTTTKQFIPEMCCQLQPSGFNCSREASLCNRVKPASQPWARPQTAAAAATPPPPSPPLFLLRLSSSRSALSRTPGRRMVRQDDRTQSEEVAAAAERAAMGGRNYRGEHYHLPRMRPGKCCQIADYLIQYKTCHFSAFNFAPIKI